jgi:hypothetical protein
MLSASPSTPPERPVASPGTGLPAALASFAALLAVVLYAGTLHNPFVYDDLNEIVENPSIRGLSDLARVLTYNQARPLTNLSYAVDYVRTGLDPVAYHATNVALHATVVILLFVLIRQLSRDTAGVNARERLLDADLGAFVAAALFAVHPMMTEAVGYVSSRPTCFVRCSCWLRPSAFADRSPAGLAGRSPVHACSCSPSPPRRRE